MIRNLLSGALWMFLVGLSHGQEARSVHITARVYLTEKGAEAGLLAEPSLVVQAGSVATFKDHITFMSPSAYDPPRIPRRLAGKVEGGGIREGKAPQLPTHEQEIAVVPPFPKDFEEHQIGLDLAFAPRIRQSGSLEVDCTLNQASLRGFSNHGIPVTIEKTAGFRGTETETVTLAANQQRRPEILKRTKTLTFNKANFSKPITFERRLAADGAMATDTNFAAQWLEDDVPAVTVELNATVLPALKPAGRVLPGTQKAQIRLTLKTIAMACEGGVNLAMEGLPPSNLSQDAFEDLLAKLETTKGSDLLSSPSLVTRSGLQGKIETVREFIYPVAFDPVELAAKPEPGSLGVTPAHPIRFHTKNQGVTDELNPRLLEDGSIEIEIVHRTSRFREFLNFGEPIIYEKKRRLRNPIRVILADNRMEMPVFSEKEIRTTLRMLPGSIAVLGGLILKEEQHVEDKIPILGDLPLLGRMGRSSKTLTTEQIMYVFVSAELIDAS